MKVLYIAGVGAFGGASRSLYEAVRAAADKGVEPYFVASRGTALGFYERVAGDVIATWGISRFDHGRYGYYRGTRWLVLIRELARLPFTVAALLRARRRWPDIELIHVNEFMELLPGLIAKALFKVPLVIHVRSPVMNDTRLWRTRWLHKRLALSADAVIAIDESVRATLPESLDVDVIHNSFDPRSETAADTAYLARLDTLRSTSLKVGFIGNLLRYKGLGEMVEAARLLRDEGEDVQFLIVGGSAASERGLLHWLLNRLGLAHNMRTELEALIAEKEVGEDFLLLGPTNDIQRVLPKMDVMAFPSWVDAPGRPVFEAAFFGVPSIVAVREPRADTLVDGETGIAVPTPDPKLLAGAVSHFSRDRAEAKRMGRNAQALAERNFRPEVNAAALLGLYRRLLG